MICLAVEATCQFQDEHGSAWVRRGNHVTCEGPCSSSTMPLNWKEAVLCESSAHAPLLVEVRDGKPGQKYRNPVTNELWSKVWDHTSERHLLVQCGQVLKIAPWDETLLVDEFTMPCHTAGLFVPNGVRNAPFPIHIYEDPCERRSISNPVVVELLKLADMKMETLLPSEREAWTLELAIPPLSRFPAQVQRLPGESSLRYSDRVEDAYYVWLRARKNLFQEGKISIIDDRDESTDVDEESALYDAAIIAVQTQVL